MGVHWVRTKVTKTLGCSIWLGKEWLWRIEEGSSSGFSGSGRRKRAAAPTLVLKGEKEMSPGRPRCLATQASRQLRARTGARGAARTAAALDREPVIPIGSL